MGGTGIGDLAAVLGAVGSIGSAVSGMTQGKASTGSVSATPSQATSDKTNSSDISANILKQEQARKAAGASSSDSILTGGLGVLGSPSTSSGSSNLLGL